MKKYIHLSLVLLALGLCILPLRADVVATSAFLLHIPESFNSNAVQRLHLFLDKNTDLPIALKLYGEESAYLSVVHEVKPRPVFGHIVLMPSPQTDEGDVLLVASNQVIGIQLGRLQTADENKYLQRIERYTLRAAGDLGGLRPCPQPRCARCNSIDAFGVDRVGMNTCPPCRMNLIKKAREKGVSSLDPLRFMPDELRQKLMKARMKEKK